MRYILLIIFTLLLASCQQDNREKTLLHSLETAAQYLPDPLSQFNDFHELVENKSLKFNQSSDHNSGIPIHLLGTICQKQYCSALVLFGQTKFVLVPGRLVLNQFLIKDIKSDSVILSTPDGQTIRVK